MAKNKNETYIKGTGQSNTIKKHDKNYNQSFIVSNKNYHLYVLFATICILPLIVKYATYEPKLSIFAWFPEATYREDFFLIYKQRFFLVISGFMLIYIIFSLISKRYKIKDSRIFIPIATYGFLAILSTLFSKYKSYSLTGSYELFESIFVLLGYCVAVYYVYLVLNEERDFKYLYFFIVILTLIMGILGSFQFFGFDFFKSQLGKNLILPIELRNNELTMTMGSIVYLTLYNPNYVGMMGALLIPVLLIMTLMYRNLLWRILSFISMIGLVISVIGSRSLTGFIGISVAFLFILILLWRYLIKYYYITIGVIVILIISLFCINRVTNNYFINKLNKSVNITKLEPALSRIETNDDKVTVIYNGNQINFAYAVNIDNTVDIVAFDESYHNIESIYDVNTFSYTITDERFEDISYGFDEEYDGVFYVNIGGKKWRFTNFTEDRTYYYINGFYKLDKMANPPAAFRGYDAFASHRGYIWSRSIPLLKNTLLLGTGPDTFTMFFPQNDYLGYYQNGYENMIITKPHNMYIQIGVQTGVLSLVAFIIFYLLYFVSSIKLYIRSRFTSFYSRLGLAIFVGTIGYMISGLAYDSSITTAPVFWVMLGSGIAINSKAKPLILQEIAELKERKARNKENITNDTAIV